MRLITSTLHGLVGLAASITSILAGLYLVTTESAAQQATVFDALMHGIGAYCIARGIWMIAELLRRAPVQP